MLALPPEEARFESLRCAYVSGEAYCMAKETQYIDKRDLVYAGIPAVRKCQKTPKRPIKEPYIRYKQPYIRGKETY